MMEEEKNHDEENQEPEITVSDKRFWKRKEEGEEEVEETKEREPTLVEQLRTEIEKKDQLLKEYIASFKKTEKENEKFRERMERSLEKNVEREKSRFIEKFLEIMDNLERAIDTTETNAHNRFFLDGIRMIQGQFINFLRDEGVEPIETLQKEFDPNIGEAVEVVSVANKKDDNVVLEEIQKGYKLNDILIRPAKVKVGKFIEKTSKKHN